MMKITKPGLFANNLIARVAERHGNVRDQDLNKWMDRLALRDRKYFCRAWGRWSMSSSATRGGLTATSCKNLIDAGGSRLEESGTMYSEQTMSDILAGKKEFGTAQLNSDQYNCHASLSRFFDLR
jgi:hypothetical protein